MLKHLYLYFCYLVLNGDKINMDLDYYSVTRGIATLQFNPDRCPHATLKAFKELIQQFEFRYITQYPVYTTKKCYWLQNQKNGNYRIELTTHIIEAIRLEWISKEKVCKPLRFFCYMVHLQQDLKATKNNPLLLIDCPWEHFLQIMREY